MKNYGTYEVYYNKWREPCILMPCCDCGKVRVVVLRRGKPVSDRCRKCCNANLERGAKISKALEGKPKSESHKRNMRGCFVKGHIAWNKGKNWSQEQREKISKTCKQKNIRPSDEAIAKAAQLNSERERTIEHRHNLSLSLKGHVNSPDARTKMSKSHKGVPLSEERRERKSQAMKKKHEDIEFSANWIKQTRKGAHIRPTKPENLLDRILQNVCPNEYKYTGAGDFMVGRKSPDFVNVNGKKKVIEVFGDYWHKNENPQDRIDVYAHYGFDCLVIWEKELKDVEQTAIRIKEFNNDN